MYCYFNGMGTWYIGVLMCGYHVLLLVFCFRGPFQEAKMIHPSSISQNRYVVSYGVKPCLWLTLGSCVFCYLTSLYIQLIYHFQS